MQARSRVRRAVFAVCGGVFAHAHYRFRKRALLVPSRCDLIPGCRLHGNDNENRFDDNLSSYTLSLYVTIIYITQIVIIFSSEYLIIFGTTYPQY